MRFLGIAFCALVKCSMQQFTITVTLKLLEFMQQAKYGLEARHMSTRLISGILPHGIYLHSG